MKILRCGIHVLFMLIHLYSDYLNIIYICTYICTFSISHIGLR